MTDPFASHQLSGFSSRGSFAGVPVRSLDDLGEPSAVILGGPFDWGTTYRPGARFGPRAIRQVDYLGPDGSRPHLSAELDPLKVLGVVDAGDIDLVPGYVDLSLDRIIEAVAAVAHHGAAPIVLGGDHTITYANASAIAQVYGQGNVALVHFDAHADTGPSHHGQLYGHGTPMRRLVESGAVPGHRFVQIGLRGYWPPPDVIEWMRGQRMRSYHMSDIVDRGLDAVVDEAVDYVIDGVEAVFLSVDIDVVDPAAAPGTGTPEPGGLTARQLLDTVRRLGRDLPLVGADIVEVSPPYDGPGEITAMLANRVVLETLTGMAQRRSS